MRPGRTHPASRRLTGGSLIRGPTPGRRRAATITLALIGLAGPAALAAPAAATTVDAPLTTPGARSEAGRDAVVATALSLRGIPYRWGGSTPAGFDCSGFTSFVYARHGVTMAHSAAAQYAAYPRVARSDLRAGDLVFFAGLGHVGMMIDGRRFVHSPRSGFTVRVDRVDGSWYRDGYVGAVRPPLGAA